MSSQSGDTEHSGLPRLDVNIPPLPVKPPRDPDEPPSLATLAHTVDCLSRRLRNTERHAIDGWEYGRDCMKHANRRDRWAIPRDIWLGVVGGIAGALLMLGAMQ